jgi:hypothetical protein
MQMNHAEAKFVPNSLTEPGQGSGTGVMQGCKLEMRQSATVWQIAALSHEVCDAKGHTRLIYNLEGGRMARMLLLQGGMGPLRLLLRTRFLVLTG